MAKQKFSVDQLSSLILEEDRTGLSKAITLVESMLTRDREEAEQLLNKILPYTGASVRIGITGVPGVGKSTFIESFGSILIEQGHKVAILAIDPSSIQSKGSILGDKTRMETLATNPNAFIRPSPTGGTLGGVASRTREAILLCEAAGYDVIIIETVGVGQSEIAVKQMTDFFLLLMLAGAGDELQGIKRGIMEMADLVAINKVDGNNRQAASLARATYANALHLMPMGESKWQTNVVTCSAIKREGLNEIWNIIQKFQKLLKTNGFWDKNRNQQQQHWFKEIFTRQLVNRFENDDNVKAQLKIVQKQVENGEVVPSAAAKALIESFWK